MENQALEEITFRGVPEELWTELKEVTEKVDFELAEDVRLEQNSLVLVKMPYYYSMDENFPPEKNLFAEEDKDIQVELNEVLCRFQLLNDVFRLGLGKDFAFEFHIPVTEENEQLLVEFYHKWSKYGK